MMISHSMVSVNSPRRGRSNGTCFFLAISVRRSASSAFKRLIR
jgi:hypothetical protein